ncbi:hypothetical protein FACS189472_06600 [Alphaproteobacteria bacterium]|nr:hypothetical protein FACS189472_06600 [Alphaproteobacteria bacterium]
MKKLICSTLALVLFASVEASPLTKREASLCRHTKTVNSQQDSREVKVQKTYCREFDTKAAWFPTAPKLSIDSDIHAAFCDLFGAGTGPVFPTIGSRDIADSYLRFAGQEGKPKIIIFGSGRIYDAYGCL